MLTAKLLEQQPGLCHGFFTRRGGVSGGLYGSLNCGFGSDDPTENVTRNRALAMGKLTIAPDRLAGCFQVHSNRVAVAEEAWALDDRPQVDALVTCKPGLALGILTADCGPVLLADATAGVVGAAHAGWRGAVSGVLEAVVAAMEDLGAARARIMAAIGPCIEQVSYEVGPEFPKPILTRAEADRRFLRPAPRDGHFLFDLKGYAANRLTEAGVQQIEILPNDTYAEDELFFSYRRSCHRGEADYGRGLSAIAVKG